MLLSVFQTFLVGSLVLKDWTYFSRQLSLFFSIVLSISSLANLYCSRVASEQDFRSAAKAEPAFFLSIAPSSVHDGLRCFLLVTGADSLMATWMALTSALSSCSSDKLGSRFIKHQ